MNLRFITCSDPREFNDIHKIVDLAKLSPRTEIAVQAHPSKMSTGMPRNEWFRDLLQFVVTDGHKINLAVHVNREWCAEICQTGKIPAELSDFFSPRLNKHINNGSLIKRWQLNMSRNVAEQVNIRALKKLFANNPDKEFIIQYNDNTQNAVSILHDTGAKFSVLYDASGGRGISPNGWSAPVFTDVPQGYSGGLSPENVAENLDKIATVAVLPNVRYTIDHKIDYSSRERGDIWIDAEGKLKTDDKFDCELAKQYILNAEHWLQKQR